MMSKALVLVNLGTPSHPDAKALGKYLSEFLMDPLVMQLPFWRRFLLVRGIIVPFRKHKTSANYKKIWTEKGSPFLVYSEAMLQRARQLAGSDFKVFLAMRYGYPSMAEVMQEIKDLGMQEVIVVPLFPQYAESSYLSAQRRWETLWRELQMQGECKFLPPFFAERFFIDPMVSLAKAHVGEKRIDHWILSYHGLPESHIKKAKGAPAYCLKREDCCEKFSKEHWCCYRAQTYHTSQHLAQGLGLSSDQWTMAFQSRLGREKWLTPSTEDVLLEKVSGGARRVALLSPSFTTDGLETLEEIGIGLRKKFLEAGGEELLLVPCLNDNVEFVSGLLAAAQRR